MHATHVIWEPCKCARAVLRLLVTILCMQDFDSSHLKNKKHWNSFTSAFFLELDDVMGTLEREGHLTIDRAAANALLKGDLLCHRCRAKCKNMPQLKAHIVSCQDAVAIHSNCINSCEKGSS